MPITGHTTPNKCLLSRRRQAQEDNGKQHVGRDACGHRGALNKRRLLPFLWTGEAEAEGKGEGLAGESS